MKRLRYILTAAAILLCAVANAASANRMLREFLDRIGGHDASRLIMTRVDPKLDRDGREVFVITSSKGKPMVEGSSILAVTTGINYYLNHYAGINLAWNRLTVNLADYKLPVPERPERHACRADYRYYLNYCTFSYSMSTWTWDRWQKEIDWMALHGINLPLQIVGLEQVWRELLMKDYGYTAAEADKFVAGPCYQAWWGMNNLEGWGGPNPDWWYERQARLGRKICDRERELGMHPVLPGFSGMVPSDFTAKTGIQAADQGGWCGFQRPYILSPASNDFASVARNYYRILHKVMGPSDYYSLDPFHEGGYIEGLDMGQAYAALYQSLVDTNPNARWVIQQWQWGNGRQYAVLNEVPKGRLVILDLFSDAQPRFEKYDGHDAVYCSLPNFGGRTGMIGRFNGVIDGYFDFIEKYPNIKGIGATPEAIEQTPVLYDMLFELPWLDGKPDPAEWMARYTEARYGADSPQAKSAWEKLRNSALDCRTRLQGPQEAIVCARPALEADRVSTWGGTKLFYDPAVVASAARDLLDADLQGQNYTYDLIDVTRQALTDYAQTILAAMKTAHEQGDTQAFNARRDEFLGLILDLDELLNTDESAMLGHWTEMARDIADESPKATDAGRNWLELNNARTLITTWGPRVASENGGLRDYSYREWGGMLRDFYYPRWKKWFDNGMAGDIDWYEWEHQWAMDASKRYSREPAGDARKIARRLLDKYLPR